LRNKIGWDKALGNGIEIAPKGLRGLEDGYGTYSELALTWETWLRDVKGFPEHQLIDHDLNIPLRKEFFNEHIEQHPDWFSDSGVKKVKMNQESNEYVYVCQGCQKLLNGTSLYTCKHK
jgi:hypothetical protein